MKKKTTNRSKIEFTVDEYIDYLKKEMIRLGANETDVERQLDYLRYYITLESLVTYMLLLHGTGDPAKALEIAIVQTAEKRGALAQKLGITLRE